MTAPRQAAIDAVTDVLAHAGLHDIDRRISAEIVDVVIEHAAEYLRTARRYDPATGRDRRINGFDAAAGELQLDFHDPR